MTHTLEHTEITIETHSPMVCEHQTVCPIHKMSGHAMRDFPQHFRFDRGIMERICTHGVGHPDPDQWEFMKETEGVMAARARFAHGCDGCCWTGGE